MLKNASKKNKCADIEYSDDYRALVDGLTNPYCYNFGKINKNCGMSELNRLKNKINFDYIYKR